MTIEMHARVLTEHTRPFDLPEALSDLLGPGSGRLTLPQHVYWGPTPTVDLSTFGGVSKAYEATLREGLRQDLVALLNGDLLASVWARLVLPLRIRNAWEFRFPELGE
jgi:hypothetical protein